MKQTDYQRIEELVNYLGFSSLYAFSTEIGLKSPQIFYDIKAGKCGISKRLSSTIQDKFLNISGHWLLTGEGEMLKNDNSIHSEGTINGGVFQAGEGNQNISIALPESGKQKIIRPDGTVEVRSEGEGLDLYLEALSRQQLLTAKAQEQIDRLLTLLEKQSITLK